MALARSLAPAGAIAVVSLLLAAGASAGPRGGSERLTLLTDGELASVIDEVAPQVEVLMGASIDTSLIRGRVLSAAESRQEQLREQLLTLGVSEPLLSASLEAARAMPVSRKARGMRQVLEKLSTASLLPITGQLVIPAEQVHFMNMDELRANVAHELVHVAQLQRFPRFFDAKALLERQMAAAPDSEPDLLPGLEQRHAARMTLLESHARLIEERARQQLFTGARYFGPERPRSPSESLREKQAYYAQTALVERLERRGLLDEAFRNEHAAELLFRRGGSVYIELPERMAREDVEVRIARLERIHGMGLKACGFAVFQGGQLLHRE